jgi:oxygen-dependent protoporphyrinogen oxidase
MNKKVAIVGAGITGLTAAYELLKQKPANIEVKIFEKSKRAGGVFVTEHVDGFLIEGGPDSFELYKPAPLELARELGMEDEIIDANEELHVNYLFINGRLQEIPKGLLGLVPQNLLSLAFCPYLSLKAKIRAGLEFFIPPVSLEDRDISLAEFYQRRFGREVFENVAEALFGSIYACIPETISLKSCWPRGMELEKQYGSLLRGMLARRREVKKSKQSFTKAASVFKSFKRGMYSLIEKLVEKIPEGTIEYNREVKTIVYNEAQSKYQIIFKDNTSYDADAVIIATSPSYETALIVKDLDRAISDMILRTPFASSATVSLAYRKKDFNHPLNGFGILVPRKEKTTIKASTWSSTKFPGRAPEDGVLIRCFVGNAQEESIVYRSDEEILRAVFSDLEKMMGVTAKPLFYRIYRWYNAMPQYTLGHKDRLKFIEEREKLHPGFCLVGNAYRGLGIGDCINEGRRAARLTIEFLKQ